MVSKFVVRHMPVAFFGSFVLLPSLVLLVVR